MADPISTAVGVVSLGIQVCHGLLAYYSSWKDCPQDVAAVSDVCRGVIAILTTAKDIFGTPQAIGDRVQVQVTEAIIPCERIAIKLEDKLNRIQTSNGAKALSTGWFKAQAHRALYPFKESTLAKLRELLSELRENVELAMHIASYKAVGIATEGIIELQMSQERGLRRKILGWLSASGFSQQQADLLKEYQLGTGGWFTGSDELQACLSPAGAGSILFCPGHPGTGKSFMMCNVIDYLQKYNFGEGLTGICYVFCNYKKQREQTIESLVESVLEQLLRALPTLPETMKEIYLHHQDSGTRPCIAQYSKVFAEVSKSFSRVFILMDAIDEFTVEKNERSHLLDTFSRLQSTLSARWIVTSRFLPDVCERFKAEPTREIRASDHDLDLYLKDRLENSTSNPVLDDKALQRDVRSMVVQKADGMFLLARLYLDSLYDKTTPREVRSALRDMHRDSDPLRQAYVDATRRIQDQSRGLRELASKVIAWLSLATRPLLVEELQHALAIVPDEGFLDEENITRESLIPFVCAGLIIIDESTRIVRFVHYTAQEYFEEVRDRWLPGSLDMTVHSCLTYMTYPDIHDPFNPAEQPKDKDNGSLVLTSYAMEHLIMYMRRSKSCARSKAAIAIMTNRSRSALCFRLALIGRRQELERVRRTTRGVMPIHLGAAFDSPGLIDVALERGYTVVQRYGPLAISPLMVAASAGKMQALRHLLSHEGVEANVKNRDGKTAFHLAAEAGQTETVKMLLDIGTIDPDTHDNLERTPLSGAIMCNHDEIVALLLARRDVAPNGKDNFGISNLGLAVRSNNANVVAMLRPHVVGPNGRLATDETGSLWRDANSWADDATKQALREFVDKIREPTSDLLHAVHMRDESHLERLIKAGAPVDTRDTYRRTPLALAVWTLCPITILDLLVSAGADINTADERGGTPLNYMCRPWPRVGQEGNKAFDIAKWLLEHGARADAPDQDGVTPLKSAYLYEYQDLVDLFHGSGYSVLV